MFGKRTTNGDIRQMVADAKKIFNKLFFDDIKHLLSMADLWTRRTPPIPIKYGEFSDGTYTAAESNLTDTNRDQRVWSIRECQSVFVTSLTELEKKFKKLAVDEYLVWNKDDKTAVDFVVACTNIRAKIFNIPQKSRFEIKRKCDPFLSIDLILFNSIQFN